MRLWVASPIRTAYSTTRSLSTGSVPGCPRLIGSTFVFGSAPYAAGSGLKAFVAVESWQCTSSPMTASYFSSDMALSVRVTAPRFNP